jgi:hemerythrin
MPIAIWMPKYETGNPAVDRQHKRLFEMVNDLHHGIIAGQGRETMGPTLKALASYTLEHFATEEGFMRSTNYGNYARHKARHDELARQVKDLIEQYDSGSMALPGSLSKFLADWLIHHIKEEDMDMITWVRGKESASWNDWIPS